MYNRKPDWLKIKIQTGPESKKVNLLLKELSLNTVCEHANCPNKMECYCNKTAAFMILGNVCTRSCSFCNVQKNACPEPVDFDEPLRVATAVRELKLSHAVITSVTRDDLPDGGALCFAEVISEIRRQTPAVTVEVLIPDFQGDKAALKKVANANPCVINHNIETVARLYPGVRPKADYSRSLNLLRLAKEYNPAIRTKSGIMVGIGETRAEVLHTMSDLRNAGCDFLTIGQYLSPSANHHPVIEYIHPDIFSMYKSEAEKIGFLHVASGPFVRSSYHAGQALKTI